MKQLSTILFFFLILTTGSASAWEGIFEIQNETFFDGDWSVANETGTPVKNLKSSGGITAWINITGFRNTGVLDNVSYVNGSPKDFAIVERGATYKLGDGTMTSFKSYLTVTDCNVTNTTTATQKTILKYEVCHTVHTTTDSSRDYTSCTTYTNTLSVSCTVDSPKTFDNNITNFSVTITAYNNSVTPYTLIHVPERENIIKSEVIYKNNKSVLHTVIGWVTTNHLGTEHVHFINRSLFIQDPNNTITHRATYYVINEAPLNWSRLYINTYTPYVKINKFGYNVTVINTKPSDFIAWKIMLVFILVVGAFVACLCSLLRSRRI